jgi:CBS domain-containing protein
MSTRNIHDDPYLARPRFHGSTVADVMHVGVISCQSDTPVGELARTMARNYVHAVVVEGRRRDAAGMEHLVWGVVSDLDVVSHMDRMSDREVTARELSATPAVVIGPDDSTEEAARLMRDYDVHHLVVVDPRERRPIGVVSTLDLVAAIAAEAD